MALFDWPGEKLAIRIWETAERFGVGLLRATQIKREGIASAEVEACRLVILAKAEQDVADLKAGRAQFDSSGALIHLPIPTMPHMSALPASTTEDLPGIHMALHGPPRLGSALDYVTNVARGTAIREVTRAINLEQIIHRAEAEARDVADKDVSDATVDDDWFARWRENVQDVSDSDIQLLWARALAGEVQMPGRFSLRTLDFLGSISKSEAELIQRLAPFAFEQFIFKDAALHEASGLGFARLIELQDLGIISGVGGDLHWQLAVSKAEATGFPCRNLSVAVTNFTKPLALPCYLPTKLGSEVVSLGKFDIDRRCVNSVVNTLIQAGATCVVGRTGSQDVLPVIEEPMETYHANNRPPLN